MLNPEAHNLTLKARKFKAL